MHCLPSPAVFLPAVRHLARQAGEAVLSVYHSAFSVMTKTDDSPVTEADQIAERLIVEGLQRLTCDIPVVAEESITARWPLEAPDSPFWLVDPLDGTEDFIQHNDEFTINIALIQKQRPVLGVIYVPVYEHLYAAVKQGTAMVERAGIANPICVRVPPAHDVVVVASRTHGDPALLEAFLHSRQAQCVIRASSSLKLCLVAAGKADFYPRFGKTMEWDTAAGHAILNAAGGRVCTTSGEELHYGKPGFGNPNFIACGAAPC
ncbi:3'(2'),5'-bisphosphate nucleotidase [invertebrate metagenome]|uniref:3'(2'),5'-bisphosphate nucleotidase n=1 Tax=invertebrate metagenome TaxID=1711999 RepID=A0A484HC77_9ZZZZ